MKATPAIQFSNEERLAIGNGELASNARLKEFVHACVQKELPNVMRRFYEQMSEEYKEKADALD